MDELNDWVFILIAIFWIVGPIVSRLRRKSKRGQAEVSTQKAKLPTLPTTIEDIEQWGSRAAGGRPVKPIEPR